MLKLDFQRAILQRIPQITANPTRTGGPAVRLRRVPRLRHGRGNDPTGDERTFALSRQARLIPIVATQSISSLRPRFRRRELAHVAAVLSDQSVSGDQR
jgi:hypothetical protein